MPMNMDEAAASQSDKKRVMLATDDRPLVDMLTALAKGERLEMLLPDTGEEAWSRLRQESVSLVVIDTAAAVIDGWDLYNRLRGEGSTASLPVLIVASEDDLADRLGTLRPDLDDYVTRPLRAQEVAYRVKQLLARGVASRGREGPARPLGRIIAFCSNKGGVGKSVLAVNMAVALRQRSGKRVAIIDGDFYYGNVGTYLGVPPVRSIMDLIPVVDEMDTEAADRVLIRHASGVRVLVGPARPDHAADVSPIHVQRVIEFLAGTYDYVVIDCQTVIDHRLMPALDLANDIMVVVVPEMGCLKNMRVLLDQFLEAGIDMKKVHVVLNRAATNVEIEARDIEQAFKQKVDFSLSSGGRPVILSINRGVPLIMDQPKNPVSQQILKMADHFIPQAKPAGKVWG